MDTSDLVLALAKLETECQGCNNIDDRDGWGSGCRDCEGEQTVPLIPGLRVACKGVTDFSHVTHHDHYAVNCCQGRTWLPVETKEAAGVIISSHWFVSLRSCGDDYGNNGFACRYGVPAPEWPYQMVTEWRVDWEDAVIAAAHAALQHPPELPPTPESGSMRA